MSSKDDPEIALDLPDNLEDLSFDVREMPLEANITFPETATFEVAVMNEGNIESEARIFTSD